MRACQKWKIAFSLCRLLSANAYRFRHFVTESTTTTATEISSSLLYPHHLFLRVRSYFIFFLVALTNNDINKSTLLWFQFFDCESLSFFFRLLLLFYDKLDLVRYYCYILWSGKVNPMCTQKYRLNSATYIYQLVSLMSDCVCVCLRSPAAISIHSHTQYKIHIVPVRLSFYFYVKYTLHSIRLFAITLCRWLLASSSENENNSTITYEMGTAHPNDTVMLSN